MNKLRKIFKKRDEIGSDELLIQLFLNKLRRTSKRYPSEAISRPAVVLGSWVALLACSLLIFLAFSAQQAALS